MTFIDDHFRYSYIYLLISKNEAPNWFKVYKAEAENQLEKTKILRSDHGGEYISNEMTEYCEEHDINHEVVAPYTPQHNDVAERKNRALMDMVNCMILNSGVPENIGVKLSYLLVISLIEFPKNTLMLLPMNVGRVELLISIFFEVWVCLAKVLIPKPKKRKFDLKIVDAMLIWYRLDNNVNRFLVVNSEITEISNNITV